MAKSEKEKYEKKIRELEKRMIRKLEKEGGRVKKEKEGWLLFLRQLFL